MDSYSGGIQVFSHDQHYILSSELKNLYVAVTRTRQRLWIYDEDQEYRGPIQMYWRRNDLAKEIWSVDEIKTPSFTKRTESNNSQSHEWDKRGKQFLEQQQYEEVKLILLFSNY